MDKNRLDALINLLDDPDNTVSDMVERELLKENEDIIPKLEQKWESSIDENFQGRLESIIQLLHFKQTSKHLRNWRNSKTDERNLLSGFCHIDRFQYPDINPLNMQLKMDKLRKNVWLELNNSLTILEKITILNHFLFNVHGFMVNTDNPVASQNCYLTQIMEHRMANPTSICLFYAIIARMLEIPAYFIDFPKNPLIGIVDEELAQKVHGDKLDTKVLFYVNPANKGAVTSRKEIEFHLKKDNLEAFADYTEPRSDDFFVIRLLESLREAYELEAQAEKQERIAQLIELFTETQR